MRCYKKGTLHMHFKDKELWERFNLTAARGKNWLPDDVKAREREDRTWNRRTDQYGPPAFRLTEGPAETRDFFMYFIEKNRLFLFTTEGAMVLIIHAISTN